MNYKETTRMVIAILFVLGSIISFFVSVSAVGEEIVRFITVAIISYYFANNGGISSFFAKK